MKNKVYGVLLTAIGVVSLFFEGDATFCAFAAGIGFPLLFAKRNWIL